MVLVPFERHPAEKEDARRDMEALQDRIVQFTDKLVAQPGLDAAFFESIVLTTGVQNFLEHGLGRAFRGWRIVDCTQPTIVFRDSTVSSAMDSKFLVLVPNATVTVSVEVF